MAKNDATAAYPHTPCCKNEFPLFYADRLPEKNTSGKGPQECGNDVLNLEADVNAVPEPSVIFLLGTGLIGIAVFRKQT